MNVANIHLFWCTPSQVLPSVRADGERGAGAERPVRAVRVQSAQCGCQWCYCGWCQQRSQRRYRCKWAFSVVSSAENSLIYTVELNYTIVYVFPDPWAQSLQLLMAAVVVGGVAVMALRAYMEQQVRVTSVLLFPLSETLIDVYTRTIAPVDA